MLKFRKIALDIENRCEVASVFDVNNDGHLDVVCGEYWYEGPDFSKKHKICDITHDSGYIWDFSDYPMDINGDGYMDVVTASWWGEGIYWRENPGNNGLWKTHKICNLTNVETIRFYDIDNDGTPEIFPNCPGSPAFFMKLITDENGKGTGRFDTYIIGDENAGHGLGVADIDGDGKPEVILSGGVLHMPEGGPYAGLWTYTKEFDLGRGACVPILAYDVNGDGLMDIIVGAGHDFGLFWFEQGKNADGSRVWTKRVIDSAWSQYHDMQLVDVNGDGIPELLTGKRYMAHNGRDPGDDEHVFICFYTIKQNGGIYRHIIDYGDPNDGHSGVGLYFWTADLNGNGKIDIAAPGKEGLYLFLQD